MKKILAILAFVFVTLISFSQKNNYAVTKVESYQLTSELELNFNNLPFQTQVINTDEENIVYFVDLGMGLFSQLLINNETVALETFYLVTVLNDPDNGSFSLQKEPTANDTFLATEEYFIFFQLNNQLTLITYDLAKKQATVEYLKQIN